MKSPLLLSLAALVLSALALALAFVSMRPDETVASVVPPPASRPDPELLARLDELDRRLDLLALRTLGLDDEPVEPTRGYVSLVEFDALREELRALRTDQPTGGDGARPGTPAFTLGVAEALGEIRREERQQIVQGKQDAQQQRLEEKLSAYQDWLGLDGNQSLEMRRALERRSERQAEILKLWVDGAADDLVNRHKQEDKQAFKADLGSFLTPSQIETYAAGWK